MAARFATVTEEGIRQMNGEATPANTKKACFINTKTTIPSVSVLSDFGKQYQSLVIST